MTLSEFEQGMTMRDVEEIAALSRVKAEEDERQQREERVKARSERNARTK